MEIQEALNIVRKLANGVHPETGEMVTSDSMYQHPQAVRALHCAIVALEFQQERERTRRFLRTRARPGRIRKTLRFVTNFARGSISKALPRPTSALSAQSSRAWCA